MTLIMQIYKIFGERFQAEAVFEIFKKINARGESSNGEKYSEEEVRTMFIAALQNLKYMGYFKNDQENSLVF